MRMLWIALPVVLATAGCAGEPAGSRTVGLQNELPRTNGQLGGGLPLFAATIVEGD
jgi:hypothetical protein